jgi:lipopolysaccharide/colanic/teichoic acid biosynthesis glycosyltransferase
VFLLIPLWIILSVSIFIEDRGPIFYRQKRLGKDGKLFTLYKFRSMYVNNIPPLELGAIKHNHTLVTHIGYVMRRLKLDETPQFLNVIVGEMSLVGPRPCLPLRIESMSLEEKKRFQVPPGLTGWAEVNGNVELTWDEQLLLDLWYVQHASFSLDMKILLKTMGVVLFGSKKNASALLNAKNAFQ